MASIDVEQISAEDRITNMVIMEKRRRICASRAVRIVERLSKKNVDMKFLSKALNMIERSHWDDIIDERNGEGLCGYVLCCEKPLQSEGKRQRYRICSRTNRVYDMEEYNPFCSVKCFNNSNSMKEKISDTPLTSRNEFKVLDLDFLEESQIADNDTSKTAAVEIEVTTKTESCDNSSYHEDAALIPSPSSDDTTWISRTSMGGKKSKKSIGVTSQKESERNRKIIHSGDLTMLAKDAVKSWITTNTVKWLKRENVDSDTSANQEELYREKVFASFGLRAKSEGKKSRQDNSERGDKLNEEKNDNIPISMPLVDGYSQTSIRKRIVLEKLSPTLKQFLPSINLSLNLVSPVFKSLVNTFSLTATNIVLRPHQWKVATLLLLKLLAKREDEIRIALDSLEGKEILSGYIEDDEEVMVEGLTETDYLSVD